MSARLLSTMVGPGWRVMRGFSLIEALVVMAVLGFALAAVAPEMGAWLRSMTVRSAAEAMRAGLERARMEALRRNTPVAFWLVSNPSGQPLSNSCSVTDSGTSWVVSMGNPGSACLSAPSTTSAPRLVERWSGTEAGRGYLIRGRDAAGAAASSVVFDGLGQVTAGAGVIARIDVTHSDGQARALRVQVTPGGAIGLCDPAVGGNDSRRCL